MIRPKNETKVFFLSITKNSETLIKHTHRKAEEKLKILMTKPGEIFLFNPTIQIKGDLIIGLIG